MLFDPNFVMFYVDNPAISEQFYTQLFGIQPVQSSPTFAMYILKSGVRLGLWSKHNVEPAATILGGGGELGLEVADHKGVDALYSIWQQRGVIILQKPTQMDFGYTFVGLDPDNHRLRVFAY